MKNFACKTPVLGIVVFLFAAAQCEAGFVSVGFQDEGGGIFRATGSRSTADTGLTVTSTGNWLPAAQGGEGFKIAWDIEYSALTGIYSYEYTISDESGGLLDKALSNIVFSLSDGVDSSDVFGFGGDGSKEEFDTHKINVQGDQDKNNDVSMYGVKVEDITEGKVVKISFDTRIGAVYGSFGAKDGAASIGTAKYNVAFNTGLVEYNNRYAQSLSQIDKYIATPDTHEGPPPLSSVPEPDSAILLGLGILGFAAFAVRRRMMALAA